MSLAPKNFCPNSQENRNSFLAKQGEALIVKAMKQQGWLILERNYRVKGSEIDIIARKGNSLVFVEVKTRKHKAQPNLLNWRKCNSLQRGANSFLLRNPDFNGLSYRFDLAIVESNNRQITYHAGIEIA